MRISPRCDAITHHHNRFYVRLNDKLPKPNVMKVAKGCSTHYRQCGTASSVSPDCRARQFIPLRGAGDPPSPQPGEGFFSRSPRILREINRNRFFDSSSTANAVPLLPQEKANFPFASPYTGIDRIRSSWTVEPVPTGNNKTQRKPIYG